MLSRPLVDDLGLYMRAQLTPLARGHGRVAPSLRKLVTFDNDTAFAKNQNRAHALAHDQVRLPVPGLSTVVDGFRPLVDRDALLDRVARRSGAPRFAAGIPSGEIAPEPVLSSNLTPRKCLGYRTPIQAMLAELGKTYKSASHDPRCTSRWNAGRPDPGQQLIQPMSKMRCNSGEDIGQPDLWIDGIHFGSDDKAVDGCARCPPRLDPRNSQDFRPRAIPLSPRSAPLFDRQPRPSSRNSVKAPSASTRT